MNAAAITPRGADGDVDFGAAFEVIDYLCAGGVSGIALFDAVGEYPALTAEERSRLLYLAVKRSRVPVLAGVGAGSLEVSMALAREARAAGAAALLLPPPYFFRYPQEDIREFYLQFAAQMGTGIPIYLSNHPRFVTRIAPETALELLETGLFAGIEDAGGLESFIQLNAFTVLVAEDAVFTAARCAGAKGAISMAACAVPELMIALDRAISTGEREKIEPLDGMLQEFVVWMNRFPHPVILKTAAQLRGLKPGPLPIPLSPARQKLLGDFCDWFSAWLPEVKKLFARD